MQASAPVRQVTTSGSLGLAERQDLASVVGSAEEPHFWAAYKNDASHEHVYLF